MLFDRYKLLTDYVSIVLLNISLSFVEVGKMWSFTHFWYLFCVILHIFHTWVYNYGAKVLKNKQGNKLPHVLYITFNQLYHIPGAKGHLKLHKKQKSEGAPWTYDTPSLDYLLSNSLSRKYYRMKRSSRYFGNVQSSSATSSSSLSIW